MLITELKNQEVIKCQLRGKVFVLVCHGCKEVYFPEQEADELIQGLKDTGLVTGVLVTDYICNGKILSQRLQKQEALIAEAETLLVLSCGVGVQTVADKYPEKRVVPGCDTYRLPGFQGVTPLQHDCQQCGECYLNLTGGICPLTACSKSLVNGQCGGAKNGKCEVDPNMDCGWERIQKRLESLGRLDVLKCPVQLRNYATDSELDKE